MESRFNTIPKQEIRSCLNRFVFKPQLLKSNFYPPDIAFYNL